MYTMKVKHPAFLLLAEWNWMPDLFKNGLSSCTTAAVSKATCAEDEDLGVRDEVACGIIDQPSVNQVNTCKV